MQSEMADAAEVFDSHAATYVINSGPIMCYGSQVSSNWYTILLGAWGLRLLVKDFSYHPQNLCRSLHKYVKIYQLEVFLVGKKEFELFVILHAGSRKEWPPTSEILMTACCSRKTSPSMFENFPFSCVFENIVTGLILLNTLHGNPIVSFYQKWALNAHCVRALTILELLHAGQWLIFCLRSEELIRQK